MTISIKISLNHNKSISFFLSFKFFCRNCDVIKRVLAFESPKKPTK